MYRAEARPNKFLWEAQKKHEHEQHVKRLRQVKAGVDVKPPKGFGEYRRNVKREQMMEDRYAQIEHENRLLLSKMSDIMQKGSLDTTSNAWQYGHSLNRTNRRKELQRITEENQSILRRIQSVHPIYDHYKWEEEAIKADKLVESICEYKPSRSRIGNRRSTSVGATMSRRGGGGGQRSSSPNGAGSLVLHNGGGSLEMGSFGASAYSGMGGPPGPALVGAMPGGGYMPLMQYGGGVPMMPMMPLMGMPPMMMNNMNNNNNNGSNMMMGGGGGNNMMMNNIINNNNSNNNNNMNYGAGGGSAPAGYGGYPGGSYPGGLVGTR